MVSPPAPPPTAHAPPHPLDRGGVAAHIREAEGAWGCRFPPGHTPSISFMAHTREPLRCLHHPLFFYAWGAAVGALAGLILRSWGLERFAVEGGRMHYWHRKGEGEAVVFLHGLGVGITPYLSFLHMLFRATRGSLVVVELPYVGLQFAPSVPTADEVVEELERIHVRHGLGPACYLGHSYGSLIIANVSPHSCWLPPTKPTNRDQVWGVGCGLWAVGCG